ncbi:MAG TPA: branched-chain amino acid ABC transporter permease [Firmicutes bacterium]|jgi:branched-chain amino acid transport system permease protein|nr:branched-chain amino acid ABC transporter permease [Bacillota bacterium]HBK61034.1 branched-chain amino acid ABC transporter permease [Bacillota bacterium]
MEIFAAQLLNGLSLGSMYVLLVLGFNLMLLVAKIIQFAYPHLVVLSMYVCWGVLRHTDNMLLVVLASVASCIVVNVAIEPIFRLLAKRHGLDINVSFVVSMSMALLITDVMSHLLNYGYPIAFPTEWVGKSIFSSGLIAFSAGQAYALFGGIAAVAAFFYLLYRTRQGRVLRAISENSLLSSIIGIPIIKTRVLSYAIAGLLGGLTAVMFARLLGSASPGLGDFVGMKVVAASILAGLGNLKGGLVCGLLLGIAESMAIGYLAGSWSNAIAFMMMLVIMLIKPEGLFGIEA